MGSRNSPQRIKSEDPESEQVPTFDVVFGTGFFKHTVTVPQKALCERSELFRKASQRNGKHVIEFPMDDLGPFGWYQELLKSGSLPFDDIPESDFYLAIVTFYHFCRKIGDPEIVQTIPEEVKTRSRELDVPSPANIRALCSPLSSYFETAEDPICVLFAEIYVERRGVKEVPRGDALQYPFAFRAVIVDALFAKLRAQTGTKAQLLDNETQTDTEQMSATPIKEEEEVPARQIRSSVPRKRVPKNGAILIDDDDDVQPGVKKEECERVSKRSRRI